MAYRIKSLIKRRDYPMYQKRRAKWLRIYDLRNHCTAIMVSLGGSWYWEVWKQEKKGYCPIYSGYNKTLRDALKEARKAARTAK